MSLDLQHPGFAAFALSGLLVAGAVGCHSLHPTTPAALQAGEVAATRELKLTYAKGWVVLDPGWRLDYPWVIGEHDELRGRVPREGIPGQPKLDRYNLEDATRIEVRQLERGKSAALGVGLGLAGGAAAYLLTAAIAAAVLVAGISCPVVSVADASSPPQAVAEVWPGALTPAEPRVDWLALPALADPSVVRVVVDNHHPEIQHVAATALAFVAHDATEIALATPDGSPLIVAGLQPPRRARVAKVEVLDRVAAADGDVWQSAQSAIRLGDREQVEARFGRAPRGELALVVRYENTLFSGALMALRLEEACAPAPLRRTGSRDGDCRRWRQREGFDAVAHVEDERGPRTLWLGAAGTGGARTVALPFGSARGRLRVRIEAGSGFLRIDQIALARVVDAKPPVERFAPVSAAIRDANGLGLRRLNPGSPVRLARTGERLELEFRPQPSGASGTWFFVGTGAYELQPHASRQLAEFRQTWEWSAEGPR